MKEVHRVTDPPIKKIEDCVSVERGGRWQVLDIIELTDEELERWASERTPEELQAWLKAVATRLRAAGGGP